MLISTVFIISTLSVAVSQHVTSEVTSIISVSAVTEPVTTVSPSKSHSEVYLHPMMLYGLPLNLTVLLDIRSSFEMSFRTCSHGVLLSQTGRDHRDCFELILDKSGSLNISWSSTTGSNSVLLGANLNDNQWYKFVWMYHDLGNVTVSVEQDADVQYEMMFLNTSVFHDLWNMSLLNGSNLHVGDGSFEGCLRDGPQMWFASAAEVDETAVKWDGCHNFTVCNRTDTCFPSPCANNGRYDSWHIYCSIKPCINALIA